MVPVPAVAGETGGVEAQDGADFAGAEAGDEPLEARTGHGAAGGIQAAMTIATLRIPVIVNTQSTRS